MNTKRCQARGGGPSRPVPRLILLLLLCAATTVRADEARHPVASGTLFIENAASGEDAAPLTDETDGTRTWAWGWGVLSVSDPELRVTAALENLSLPYGADLYGVSRGRRLLFRDGEYPVDGALLLRGAGFQLFVSRGTLSISADALTLADRETASTPSHHQYLLFLGVLLITIYMMLKARARTRRS